MPKKALVIVESPTKAKTIKNFLGNNFIVKSSFGHVIDLPKKTLGVDTENNYIPEYETMPDSKKVLAELRKLAKDSSEIIFATDEDREGEAISWHLANSLKIKPDKAKRIVFHEITKSAIDEALNNARTIDLNLVDAQQARRILDRLVGYKLSPLLWNKIRRGLSAGRVQSAAVRLVVKREEEINKFKPEEYWTIEAIFEKLNTKERFPAKLWKIEGKTLAKFDINNKKNASKLVNEIKNCNHIVSNIKKTEKKKSPPPPFITSSLQQTAANTYGFTAKRTMMAAQKLYEGMKLGKKQVGLITYMRTDSFNLANKALTEIKSEITNTFGKDYALQKPRYYRKKTKGAQEAHEAIRPTKVSRHPEDIKQYLNSDQYKLYSLIWKRTMACQMKEAIYDQTAVTISSKQNNIDKFNFKANGSLIKFPGFLKIYDRNEQNDTILPNLEIDESLSEVGITPSQHFTEPPARYTEASLIKALEQEGIGRPSTYAPIMTTIQTREYVEKIEKKFHPTEIGTIVDKFLVEYFPKIVDLKFTREMEQDLDDIADDKKELVPTIDDFYKPFIKNIKEKEKTIDKKKITEEKTDKKCKKCGKPMVIKLGRFGKFLACSNYPDCKNTEPLGEEKKLQQKYSKEKCDKCGKPMTVKTGRFGPFLGCSGYPDCKNIKPIIKKTGVKCPECKKGNIIEKKSKKGRIFFACDKYPDCKYALWNKPTGKKCKKCKSLMVVAGKNKTKCSNKECPTNQNKQKK